MIKTFLILLTFSTLSFASQQIVLVVAKNFTTHKAKLYCIEEDKLVCNEIDVNIGKKGLGWGLGMHNLSHNHDEPLKFEGDKKAPSGIFKLSSIFGIKKRNDYNAPYIKTSKNLICVDDSASKNYNQIIAMPAKKPQSFENMKREDTQYELGIVVDHNKQAIAQRGSCIFMHVQKEKDAGTAGCTSMELKDLQRIASWLDVTKDPILIQIPQSYFETVAKLYPKINLIKN